MENPKELLSVEGVCKSFRKMSVIDHCSFSVAQGTITALIGPNGAGKTTLFNLISGFHRPDTGRLFLKGARIDGFRPDKIFHRGLIRTFQISRELEKMTLLENLMLVPAHQLGERIWNAWFFPWRVREQEKRVRERALETLNFVELYHLKDQYAGNISTGQKRLLEIARTMMADPEIILLDEPGAGVNPTLMNKLIGYIQRLNERGITFLIVEHNMELVMSLCNPVIVMNAGAILMEGEPEAVRNDEHVINAYLGG
jgi:branched-chain amino acid transport system ATP-binding protein